VRLPVFLIETQSLTAGPVAQLSGDEAHHATKALRMQVGERLVVTDGMGKSAEAEVTGTGNALEIRLDAVHVEPHPDLEFTVVQALPKADRGELAVELLTEVGVNTIVPWQAARNIAVWRDEKKRTRGQQRWESAARAAAKQSRRVWWPKVAELMNTSEVASLISQSELGVVLHEGAQEPLINLQLPAKGRVTLVVGPEGGLNEAELALLRDAGAHVCVLGPTVLRTSTAGAVSAAVLMSQSMRWSR
jgi:16S rRNA (uracil1498-N3)-methyltransferase